MYQVEEDNFDDDENTEIRTIIHPASESARHKWKWLQRLRFSFYEWCEILLSAVLRRRAEATAGQDFSYKSFEVEKAPWWCECCQFVGTMPATREGEWACPACNAGYYLKEQALLATPVTPLPQTSSLLPVPVDAPTLVPTLLPPVRKRHTVPLHGTLYRMILAGQVYREGDNLYYTATRELINTRELKRISQTEMEAMQTRRGLPSIPQWVMRAWLDEHGKRNFTEGH